MVFNKESENSEKLRKEQLISKLKGNKNLNNLIDSVEEVIAEGNQSDIFLANKAGRKIILKVFYPEKSIKLTDFDIQDLKIASISAKREYLILKKCFEVGLLVPEPYEHIENAFTMEYIEEDGRPAPTLFGLKGHDLDSNEVKEKALEVVEKLYEMNMINIDVNEYNILVKGQELYFIDFEETYFREEEENGFFEEEYKKCLAELDKFFSRLERKIFLN